MSRVNFSAYGVGFAIVNFIEALAILLSMGTYSPGWVMRYASSHALRNIAKRTKGGSQ